MIRRRALAAALAAAALGACAKSAFPPGGPLDTIPPYVVVSTPADSSVGVARTTAAEVLFSEGMDPTSVRDGLRLYPPAGRPVFDWSGRRLRVSWERPFAESTTYILLLSGSARDSRGVAMGRPLTLRFSTGPSLDRGRVTGVLRAKTLPTKGVPILAFADSLGPRPDTSDVGPSYATETDTSGAYALTALPFGRGFTVHAFYDQNRNGYMEDDVDILAGYPGSVRLTPEHPVADSINIVAVNPLAPGIVTGTVATSDSTARIRIEARDLVDTSYVHRAERTGPGAYTLRIPAARYRLTAVRAAAEGAKGLTLRLEEPLDVEPEGEYGPFVFDFEPLEAPTTAPMPEGEPPPEEGKE